MTVNPRGSLNTHFTKTVGKQVSKLSKPGKHYITLYPLKHTFYSNFDPCMKCPKNKLVHIELLARLLKVIREVVV